MTKAEWLEKNGFSQEGITYCVYGDDTYAIKDHLKELGFKFSPLLKWHCGNLIKLPEGYILIKFTFDDLCQWSEEDETAYYYENAKEKIDRAFKEAAGPSLSEYIAEPGKRIRNLTAVFKSVRGFAGAYGWTNIYTFESGYNVLVWFTQKDLELEKGTVIDLTGTVKKHEEFRGVKTTQLSRCIIKEIN